MTQRKSIVYMQPSSVPLTRLRTTSLLLLVTRCLLTGALVLHWGENTIRALDWPGPVITNTQAEVVGDDLRLQNTVIGCAWTFDHDKLRPLRVATLLETRTIIDMTEGELFRLVLTNGQVIAASEMKLVSKPTIQHLAAKADSSILAERFPGQQFRAHLRSADGNLRVEWRAILREGANAIRQEFVFEAKETPIPVKEARLVDAPAGGAAVMGSVPGSPIVVGNVFFAYEHPDAQSAVTERATAALSFNSALQPNRPVAQSAVVGVAPRGQLRRGFLYYVERERAHPYRPFLHYNAWYDICWGNRKINEGECLDVIDQFGRELIEQRHVPLVSFVWDDGWDDPKTLWRPLQENFPNGFAKTLAAARRYHSTLGFWLSPFGGYGQPKEDRIAMGKAQGFETGLEGFSLAGPKYYARFLDTCSQFIDQNGANFFKFDGLARSVHETEAMLRLTRALRTHKPDLFISITTGTWPSPFWLWYGDSTWRGGGDMGFHGAGSKREQWMTYRDMETFRNVVQAAPLYPINSLMNQGFAHARYGTALEVGSNADEIRRELRSLFASGTCLQELYVTPSKMSGQNWDDLAECATWAHANSDVLMDTHWIGGDPGKGEAYGWASWSPRKGILALRNPAAEMRTISIDVAKAFELPPDASRRYVLKNPWKDETGRTTIELEAGKPHFFQLEPFQVLVWDALLPRA
jgi:hypothetical protein